ncbi:hypothetical protein QF031_003719 [Pseudarthrobacter defluvii]|uniref:hypothetical protein n=1 Tax=Pseudarthrobacter defluvii TaxID=410837 RepID=UPI002781D6EA|nr:hypothetical protein [Pseudarthrobacter defluvii]MDQ0770970.1 hypothetical protein [Pseudarthrobacter defluvii]
MVVLLAGYITMQLQLVEAHGYLGFNERFVSVEGDWLRYVWPVLLVALVAAAVLVYRVAGRGTVARLTTLGTLVLVVLLAIPMASGPRLNPDEHYPLMTYIAVEGAKSPVVLALIGALVADLIATRGRVSGQPSV